MNTQTTYVTFSSIDYSGVDSLSTYALQQTPLIFKIDPSDSTIGNILWDFGDGSISTGLSTSKYYTYPGQYNVNIVVYDCDNNAKVSTYNRTITVKNYIEDTFNLKALRYLISEDGQYIIDENNNRIRSESMNLKIKAGEIAGPIEFYSYCPPYKETDNVFYEINAEDTPDYWNFDNYKYNHLKYFNTLYSKVYNFKSKQYEYLEIDKIEPVYSKSYCKLENNTIKTALSSDADAFFVGWSGYCEIYLKNDKPCDLLTLKMWKDKTKILDPRTEKYTPSNNLSIILSSTVIDNTPTKLSITSNGIDGEGVVLSSFNIHNTKFFATDIPFVVKFKDINNFTVKQHSLTGAFAFNVLYNDYILDENGDYLISENGDYIITEDLYPLSSSQYTINSLSSTLSSSDYGSFYKGYLSFYDTLSNLPLQNVVIRCEYNGLSGESNSFNVYPNNYWDIYKNNEDFISKNTFRDISFQETLFESHSLFDDFLGPIFGDDNYTHESIGTKTYERISNFSPNINDVDVCNIEALRSHSKFLNDPIGNDEKQYPEKVSRILNLASIDKSNLIGETNKFAKNLNPRGEQSKSKYGKNLGDLLDVFSYTVNINTPIVAYEKFSNSYTLLNTYQPLSSVGSANYALSSYSPDWGWPLVLPNDFVIGDISKYYEFYSYIDQIEGDSVGGVIDFSNTKTNISQNSTYSELYGEKGILENMFTDTLYQSLSLIK